ncbi:MAG: flavodoxin family protein, partial [Epsilonproteobacteria bacterium]
MKKVLIINAHQFYEGFAEGKLNQTLVDVAKESLEEGACEVQTTILDKGYEIEEEIAKHEWADVIITQTPVYWFSTPWIHKKYIDEVFTAALMQGRVVVDDGRTREDPSKQYGTGGLLDGKKFMISMTWNAPSDAFSSDDQFLYEGKSIDDAFIWLNANYKFCGANILPSFACHDVLKNPDIDNDIIRYKAHLNTVVL